MTFPPANEHQAPRGKVSMPRSWRNPQTTRPPAVTVSGSFRRFMDQVATAVKEAESRGAAVLSPSEPEIIDRKGGFAFLASDNYRSIRMTEDRHLDAIKRSDFVWLVCPGGYVGTSAAMEVAFAVALQIPVYASTRPSDDTVAAYVTVVPTMADAIRFSRSKPNPNAAGSVLLTPEETLSEAQQELNQLTGILEGSPGSIDEGRGWNAYKHWQHLRNLLDPPTGW